MDTQPVTLAFEEHGQGQPLVLVHGFPLNRTIWGPLVPHLEGHAHLLLPDLRGFGGSPQGEGPSSMRAMADDLLALLDQLGIEKAILAGHSMGGYVCLAFAHAHPQRLSGLALVCSQAAADLPERRQARLKQAREVLRKGSIAVADAMAPRLTNRPELVETVRGIILSCTPKAISSALKAMAERPDVTDWLADIFVPALVVAGGQDAIMPLERSRLMAQLLGRAGLVEIPTAAHMPMLEEPQALAQALRQLL